MKVGDYVRTKAFGIRKITFIDEIALECGEYSFGTDISIPGFCDFSGEDIIGKPSPNIIDLIEVGDYVNGNRVLVVENREIFFGSGFGIMMILKNEEIKSIVTKEQFESMEYRIGD